MMNEQDLRDRLGEVAVPPSRLDTAGLVERGRRRVLRRRVLQAGGGVALAAALLIAVPSLVVRAGGPDGNSATVLPAGGKKQTVTCAVDALPVPVGMTAVEAVGVDPTGRYIIGNNVSYRDSAPSADAKVGMPNSQAVLWTDGQPQALPLVGSGTAVSATDVNAGGVVVAIAGEKKFDSVVRYVGGVATKLNAPSRGWTFRSARVNTAGDVLATAYRNDSPDSAVAVLVWKAGSTSATQLPLPAGAEAVGITDGGTIVGTLVTGSSTSDITAYTWDQQGHGRKLPVPAGQHGSVNGAQGDWAVGNLWDSGTAIRWNLVTGVGTDLGIHAPANGVNGEGWFLSDSTVQREDAKVQLATLNGVKGEPEAVSDTGTVVGSILVADSQGLATSAGPLKWQCGN
jgi:hypothetical protein